MTLLRRLSTATAAATLALVAIGGLVRATGSGDACPDWPRCFGKLIPPLDLHTLIEYSHRLSAAIAALLIVATAWVAWRSHRRDPAILWPILGAVGVVVVQAAIGRIRIGAADPAKPLIVTVHFLVAMALVALVMITVTATRISKVRQGGEPIDRRFRVLAWWSLGITALLLLLGAYVRGAGAGLVFLDWPLMDGRVVPDLSTRAAAASFAHRVLAAAAVVLGAFLAVRSNRVDRRGVRLLAWSAFALLIVQAGLGAAAVLSRLAPPTVAGHVAGSSLAWACLVALAVAIRRLTADRSETTERPRRGTREAVAAYLQLTKPDIIVLLLITTVPTMVLAAGGMPGWALIGATLLGGALTAGGAGAVNGFLDRDIDEVMRRTRHRPIPSNRVGPRNALRFGSALIVSGTAWLAVTVNVLSALLALSAAAFYIFVYTVWMKRSTPQNIVIGGAAGAAPALIGWAAVTGTVQLPAVVLFAIVFYWTPPHFWALSLRYANEYRAAGIPMLPVVQGPRETARHIFLYSLLLLSVSLLLFPVAGMGTLYLAAAAILGGVFVGYAIRVMRHGGSRSAMSLFRYSITYLGLLFAAVAADQLVRGAG